jgi:hypothetical protein
MVGVEAVHLVQQVREELLRGNRFLFAQVELQYLHGFIAYSVESYSLIRKSSIFLDQIIKCLCIKPSFWFGMKKTNNYFKSKDERNRLLIKMAADATCLVAPLQHAEGVQWFSALKRTRTIKPRKNTQSE